MYRLLKCAGGQGGLEKGCLLNEVTVLPESYQKLLEMLPNMLPRA